MYTDPLPADACPRLPLNLLDALRSFQSSPLFPLAFGAECVASYLKLKHGEWQAYAAHLSSWEREHTLDC
jgi:glutamine synthetase